MTTVGEISVKISADLAPLRKAQAEAKKIMGDLDKALNNSAKTVGGAFGTTWSAQVGQFNAGATKITTNLNEVSGAFQKAGEQAQKSSKPVQQYATHIKNAGQFSQQAAFQFNDLFVQLASGQSAFTAITQQGAQLSQMFTPGTGIGAAAKQLGGAFVSFLINPLNLAVVAIAGVAAAVPAIWEAVGGSDAEDAKEVLDEVNNIIKDIEKNSPNAAKAIQQIMDAASGKNTLQAQIKTTREELQKLLNEQKESLITLVSTFGGLDSVASGVRVQLRDALKTDDITRFRDILSSVINDPSFTAGTTSQGLAGIAAEILGASSEASKLEQNIRALGVATSSIPTDSLDQIVAKAESARLSYEQGITTLDQYNATLQSLDSGAIYYQEQAFKDLQSAIDNLDPGPAKDDLQEIYDKAADGELSADQFRTAIENLGISFDIGGVLASISGITSAAASAMAAIQTLRANGSQLPALGTLTPLESVNGQITGDTMAIQNERARLTQSQFQIEQAKAARRGGGGRKKKAGGGGSKGEGDRDFLSDLKSENEFLQKQLDLMGLGYDERVRRTEQLKVEKDIRDAITRLGEKASPAMKAAVEEQIRLQQNLNNQLQVQKEAQDTLNDAYQGAAQDIGSAITGAINGTEDLGQAFIKVAARIAEAVIQAQILQSFTGADGKMTQTGGILSSLVKGLFSFDGGGFTGSGNRSGGVDGKGGFAAILHPNETVVDHTKSAGSISVPKSRMGVGSLSSPTQIELSVISNTDTGVITDIADARVKNAAPAIVRTSISESQKQTKTNMPGYLANAQARQI